MNTLKFPFFIIAAITTMAVNAQSAYDDDIYYNPSKDKKHTAPVVQEKTITAPVVKQEQTTQYYEPQTQPVTQVNNATDTNTVLQYNSNQQNLPAGQTSNNNAQGGFYDDSFSYDDYYDYEYATRLRRFHHGCGHYGYYDNYYTNTYWYNSDPYYWGSSIYLGYSWWGPSYYSYAFTPNLYFGYGYGYGTCWGYNPWNYGYGYGYGGGYWNGYNNGYWNGYHNGLAYNNYYYNSYDNNSYYGGRGNSYYGGRGSSTNGTNGRQQTRPTKTFAETYMASQAQATENSKISSPVLLTNNNSTNNGSSKPNIYSNTPTGTIHPVQSSQPTTTASPFGTSTGGTKPYSSVPVEESKPVQSSATTTTKINPWAVDKGSNPVGTPYDQNKVNTNAGTNPSQSTAVTSTPVIIKPAKADYYDDYNPVVKPSEAYKPSSPPANNGGGNGNYQNRTYNNSGSGNTNSNSENNSGRSSWGGSNNSGSNNSGGSRSTWGGSNSGGGNSSGGRSSGGSIGGGGGGGRSSGGGGSRSSGGGSGGRH